MKNCVYTFLFFLFCISFQSCVEDDCETTRKFKRMDPVYMSKQQIRVAPQFGAVRPLENPGKIYFYNDYFLINEQGEGIHIYDNSMPANPVNLGFITIPGNFDMAIQNGRLYADNVIDLLTIDITDINNPILVDRDEDVFENWEHPTFGHIAYYRSSDVIEDVSCDDINFDSWGFGRDDQVWVNAENGPDVFDTDTGGDVGGGGTGTGGSTARFTIYDEYLYMVSSWQLNIWNISDNSNPYFQSSKDLGWGIETIFPYEDKLFIGSNSGMYIFDNSSPSNPELLSVFQHATACDPVVVEGNTAYVTLRDGNECQGFINQLDVIDISDLLSPTIIKSYSMSNPHGLAVKDNTLFLCEGDFGLKVFDVADKLKIDDNMIEHQNQINAYDVIALPNDVLMMIGSDGFYQYTVKSDSKLELISQINVNQ